MKTIAFLFVLISLVFTGASAKSSDRDIPEYLESIAVKIKVPNGTGSGVAFTRKDWTGTNNITFVWTAAHVIQRDDTGGEFRMMFFGQTGTSAPVIEHAQVMIFLYDKDGIVCGITNRAAHVIKYSDNQRGHDLAVLQLDGPYFNTNSAVFDLTDKPRRIGTKVISVGAPFGMTGTYVEGVISMVGGTEIGNSFVLDQTSCPIYPGNSGGGVYDTNGVCIGMSTITTPNAWSLNLIVPVRRMHDWAKKECIEWTIDPKVSMPSEKDYKSIKIMDTISSTPPHSLSPVPPPAPSSGKKKQDTRKQ